MPNQVQHLQAKLQRLGQQHQHRQPAIRPPRSSSLPVFTTPTAPKTAATVPQIPEGHFSELRPAALVSLPPVRNKTTAVSRQQQGGPDRKVAPANAPISRPVPRTARSREEPASETTEKATEEAAQLAAFLRQRHAARHPPGGLQAGTGFLLAFWARLGRSLTTPLDADLSTHGAAPPTDTHGDITLWDAILWVAASAAARVGLDLLLLAHSGLWLPVAALIITPAAIAIYRTMVNPQAGFALGRQLLLIMIGLLLGGRIL